MRKAPTVCSLVLALAVPALAQSSVEMKPTEPERSLTSCWGDYDGSGGQNDFFATDGGEGTAELFLMDVGWFRLPEVPLAQADPLPPAKSWNSADKGDYTGPTRIQAFYHDGNYVVFTQTRDGDVRAYTTDGMTPL